MFLHAEMMSMATGTPPQEIIDKRPWWYVLIGVLGVTMILRLVCFDLLGGLLCALMICLCLVIIRDGMRELPKFALLFGLLCGINFVFYAMPVLTQLLCGRSEQHVQPAKVTDMHHDAHHVHMAYTLSVKTIPFFDPKRGWMYNARSAGELLMPVAMLLGTYLGISAHYSFQSQFAEFMIGMDDDDDFGAGIEEFFTGGDTRQNIAADARQNYGAIFGAATGGVPPPAQPKVAHKAFQGTSHKLAP